MTSELLQLSVAGLREYSVMATTQAYSKLANAIHKDEAFLDKCVVYKVLDSGVLVLYDDRKEHIEWLLDKSYDSTDCCDDFVLKQTYHSFCKDEHLLKLDINLPDELVNLLKRHNRDVASEIVHEVEAHLNAYAFAVGCDVKERVTVKCSDC